jgi:hypothetical protein
MDDKSGKPKTPEQLLAEVLAYAKGHHETITANLLRMLGNARAKSQKEEFEELRTRADWAVHGTFARMGCLGARLHPDGTCTS